MFARSCSSSWRTRTSTTTKATTTTVRHASSVSPSWSDLEAALGPSFLASQPISVDTVVDPATPFFLANEFDVVDSSLSIPPPLQPLPPPVLFRERHGWCPYSERVWLALEIAGIEYYTVRIDNTQGPRPMYYFGQTPQMKWPEKTSRHTQGESLDLLEEVDARYCNGALRSHEWDVQQCIAQVRNIFPRARPSSRAAYLFQYNGDPLPKTTFQGTLHDTNDLLGQTEGPFFCGPKVTAADVAWAPFLERYRYQLPLLHPGLNPADPTEFPKLAEWYQAMEDTIPAYACRVKGDASSWRKVLTMAGFGNDGVFSKLQGSVEQYVAAERAEALALCNDPNTMVIWNKYRATRPHVAATPHDDVAALLCRNRHSLVNDIVKRSVSRPSWTERVLPQTYDDADATLRLLTKVMIAKGQEQEEPGKRKVVDVAQLLGASAKAVGDLAVFLDERMCVPRDMGAMSAAALKVVAMELDSAASSSSSSSEESNVTT
jgi:glutathione S-transferase